MFGKKFVGRLFGNGNGRKLLFGKKQTQGCKGNRQGTKEESSYNEERSTVVCVCPRCGYTAPHQRGISCRSILCPSCNAQLERRRKDEIKDNEIKSDKKPIRKIPVVNIALCTGCGNCVDACPFHAIVIENSKAVIDESLCKKCRKCIPACPSDAIS